MAPNVPRSTSGTLIAGAIDLGAMITMPLHAAVAIACNQRRRIVECGAGGGDRVGKPPRPGIALM